MTEEKESPHHCGLQAKKKPSGLFLPKAIAVLGERLGCKVNKVNLSAGLPDVQLGRAFKRTLTKQDRDPTQQSIPPSLLIVKNRF